MVVVLGTNADRVVDGMPRRVRRTDQTPSGSIHRS